MIDILAGGWTTSIPTITAAFLGALVEFVEALTIVLAVGMVRGWAPAMLGTIAGLVLLTAIVIVLGPLLAHIPIRVLQLAVGILLLLFGMRWLRKAILRSAGIIAIHDEAIAFASEREALQSAGSVRVALADPVGVIVTFKAVVLEGLEVVFIVISLGAAADKLVPASAGALAAAVLVAVLGLALRRPLVSVPENVLKFSVGVLISAFGTYWMGEGLGMDWPGGDLAIVALVIAFTLCALALVPVARSRQLEARQP